MRLSSLGLASVLACAPLLEKTTPEPMTQECREISSELIKKAKRHGALVGQLNFISDKCSSEGLYSDPEYERCSDDYREGVQKLQDSMTVLSTEREKFTACGKESFASGIYNEARLNLSSAREQQKLMDLATEAARLRKVVNEGGRRLAQIQELNVQSQTELDRQITEAQSLTVRVEMLLSQVNFEVRLRDECSFDWEALGLKEIERTETNSPTPFQSENVIRYDFDDSACQPGFQVSSWVSSGYAEVNASVNGAVLTMVVTPGINDNP